jgi:hypothetical protein
MRGLEVTILAICLVLALPITALLLPTYNGGNGIPTGTNDVSGVNAFNWSKLDNYKLNQNPSILQQAEYYFNFAVLALTGMATILFSAIWAAPALLAIFGINPIIVGVLLALLAIVIIIAWLQIVKSDDWSARR